MIARIVLWSLADSTLSIGELHDTLGWLDPPSAWIWNEPAERFGLIAYGAEPPELAEITALIGREPDLYEEFDVLG